MNAKTRFLTVGTSAIAEQFLRGAHGDPRFAHTAAYSRHEDPARAFLSRTAEAAGTENEPPRIFTDLDEAARSDAFDAAYIASPNSLHFEQTMLLLSHGKHVLCEKPFASDSRQVRAMCALAREKGLTLMEAVKTTHTPTFAAIRAALPQIGPVRRYFASYCQYSSRYDRFKAGGSAPVFSAEFSGGSLVDIGIYGLYPLIVWFGPPEKVEANALKLRSGVDGQGSVTCRYPDMEAVVIHSKITDSSLPSEIQGEAGRIVIDRINAIDRAHIEFRDGTTQDLSAPHEQHDMVYELSAFIDTVEAGRTEHPINSFENSLAVMEIMDQARRQNGIVYPTDEF